MSADLYGGDRNWILWTDGVFLVVGWCRPFNPEAEAPADPKAREAWVKRQRDLQGILTVPAEAVQKAHAAVPTSFAAAKAAGLVPDGLRIGPVHEDGFNECRAFLAEAARQGAELKGGY